MSAEKRCGGPAVRCAVHRQGADDGGAAIRIEHFRAVGPGDTVEVFAEPSAATRGRRLTFTVWALGSSDDVVAVGGSTV